ncbi:MAG TPA: hypothetical protein VEI03_14155 [Stellaceae bacterium]|nr:hypothetical protein [Stellaceae bacterium]
MSTSRAAFLGALAGTISALLIYGMVVAMEALKSFFPITYVYYHDEIEFRLIFMFWPQGFGFFAGTSEKHVPVLSFTYVGFLLLCILLNAVGYSMIAAIGRRCLDGAKAGLAILALSVLAYWTFVIVML